MSNDGHTSSAARDDEGDDDLDFAAIKEYLSFVPRAARRHKLLVFTVFVLVVSMAKFVAWVLPRHYYAETRFLAQHDQVIGAIAMPSRMAPEDNPTRLAQETVLRRDNLLLLVKSSDLLRDWKEHRHPVARVKDDIMAKLGFVPSDADMVEALVAMLEASLSVQPPAGWGATEGTMVIGVDWSNPAMTYKLATLALQNFLDARYVSEIDSISEAISILAGRADTVRQEIDAAALLIEAAGRGAPPPETAEDVAHPPPRDSGRRPRLAPAQAAVAVVAPGSPPPITQEAIQIRTAWEGRRAAIRDLEDIRRRKLAELQMRLTELKTTYADSYPLMLDTKRSIDMLEQESPQVAQLRREEADLHRKYLELTGDEPDAPPRAARPSSGLAQLLQREPGSRPAGTTHVRDGVAAVSVPAATDDRGMEFLKAQLRLRMDSYDRLLERIDNAKMEMQTAEVTFKYRYTVIRPAQLPLAPTRPNVTPILVGGAALGIVLALLLAVLVDLLSGRVVERWQIERNLKLPVVGELHIK